MKITLNLMPAPTGMQPGNYVKAAYAEVLTPATSTIEVESMRNGDSWEIAVRWHCPSASPTLANETDRFVDAVALMVPSSEHANWITMGSVEAPIEGVLWRADRSELLRVDAQGLGTVQRSPAPAMWRVKAEQANEHYTVRWLFPKWENLTHFGRCAIAVWQGSERQRAGLKSVTAGWVTLNEK